MKGGKKASEGGFGWEIRRTDKNGVGLGKQVLREVKPLLGGLGGK